MKAMRLKHFILSLALLPFGLSVALWAQVEQKKISGCIFNFQEYQSPLDKKVKFYKSLEPAKKDMTRNLLTQTAILKTGEELQFSSGGCAHHSFTYTYLGVKNGGNDFDRAISLLEKSPDNEGNAQLLMDALKDAKKKEVQKKSNNTYDLPCGDALCILDVSQKNRLQLTYDFAL